MGDLGDDFRAWRELKRERKEEARAAIPDAIRLLEQAGVSYRRLDQFGEHYRVAERFDWWPSTGRWRSLDGKKRGFKVRGLIAAIAGQGTGGSKPA